jgi:thermostable 8-oxoguanine DNA glycosylase
MRSALRVDDFRVMEFTWGPYWVFGTASYWISQYRSRFGQQPIIGQAFGRDLLEETAACILGGYGIPAEVGLAAFRRVRDEGLLREGFVVCADRIRRCLEEPLRRGPTTEERSQDGVGRLVRYRFARQRADRIAASTRYFVEDGPAPTADPLELRRWLLGIPGVGLKTASWIVRNQTGSDAVAIVDIHLRRAGVAAGFFDPAWEVTRDYALFEKAFLGFARLGGVPASGLDALIWDEQRVMTARSPVGSGLPAGRRDWSWALGPAASLRVASFYLEP